LIYHFTAFATKMFIFSGNGGCSAGFSAVEAYQMIVYGGGSHSVLLRNENKMVMGRPE
jgi:hypothetical protein